MASDVLCGCIHIFVFAVLTAGFSSTAEHVPADILNESSLQRHKDKPGKGNLTFVKLKQSIRVRGRCRVFYQMGKNKDNQKRDISFQIMEEFLIRNTERGRRGNYISGIMPSALPCIIS